MLHHDETFIRAGQSFKVSFPQDDTSGETPWDREDGHGTVSDWTTRDKRPGERVLASDGRCKRFYDIQGAMVTAKRDGWDAEPLGQGTAGERAARAVESDFARMENWCRDLWTYVGVVVTLLDEDGDETDNSESVWGIESDCYKYLTETAFDLADEILSRTPSPIMAKLIRQLEAFA